MKNVKTQTIELNLEGGDQIRLRGEGLSEPDKNLILERALEIAAVESRPGSPEQSDYENAARELSADATIMDRGDHVSDDARSVANVTSVNSERDCNGDDFKRETYDHSDADSKPGRLHSLLTYGQSYWLDNLTREMFYDNEISQRIEEEGLRGITSNPKTFSASIRQGRLYDADVEEMAKTGLSVEEIYEALMVEDVRGACDALKDVYEISSGKDGFVSIEVDPRLARDVDGTIEAAKKLWKAVNRQNVMIKVPATIEGLDAIEAILREGINVNVTLIFSVERYRSVVARFLRALRHRRDEGASIDTIASVASFFLSRIDSKIDPLLTEHGLKDIRGRVALSQAKMAYSVSKEAFSGDAWNALASEGASLQRLLWASTTVKDEDYRDTLYVDELIGKDTVNTMSESTAAAFSDHGVAKEDAIERDAGNLQVIGQRLQDEGIVFEDIAETLEQEGIEIFVAAFEEGIRSVGRQVKQVRGDAI